MDCLNSVIEVKEIMRIGGIGKDKLCEDNVGVKVRGCKVVEMVLMVFFFDGGYVC